MSEQTRETDPLLSVTARSVVGHGSDAQRFSPIDCASSQELDYPEDWCPGYRRGVALLLAATAFTSTFTCIGIASRAGQIVREVGGKEAKLASVLFVTIWELGEATGPMIIAPLSELYGRYVALKSANALFITGILLTGVSQNTGWLIFARFFTGSAVAHNVLNAAILRDVFPSHALGSAISSVMLAIPLAGVISPLCASLLSEDSDWHRILWAPALLATACQVGLLRVFRETYKPHIIRSEATTARPGTTGRPEESLYAMDDGQGPKSALWLSFLLPARILYDSSLLQALTLWGGVAYSSFYFVVTTLPGILEEVYGFSSGVSSASLAILSIGSIIGIIVSNLTMDSIHSKLRRNEDSLYPEARLIPGMVAAVMIPLALTAYGFAVELRWPVAFLLTAVAGLGCFFSMAIAALTTYATDTFRLYSASAMSSILTVRCVMGTFLPLVIVPLTKSCGYGCAFTIAAASILALAVIPAAAVLYGPSWRQRSKYTKSPCHP